MAIVILNQGGDEQLPGLRFDAKYGGGPCPVQRSDYRAIGVEFGLMTGSNGGTGINLYDRARGMADNNWGDSSNPGFADVYDPQVHDWLSINYENPRQVQLMQRGISSGLDPDVPIPGWFPYLQRDGNGDILDGPDEQVGRTVAEYLGRTYSPSDPITWRQAYDALMDAHGATAQALRSRFTGIKINHWWKHSPNAIPLRGNGWYQNPPMTNEGIAEPAVVFGVDSVQKSAFAGANLINGARCWATSGGVFGDLGNAVSGRNASEWGDAANGYPTGSYDARGLAIAFEQAANAVPLVSQAELVSPQIYTPYSGRSLTDFPVRPGNLPAGEDLVCVTQSRYADRTEMRDAMKLQIRQTWLSSAKYHGDAATIGTELCIDAFIDGIPDIGHAMSHDDYIELRVQPCLDPITQDEVARYDLPTYWSGNIIVPKNWTFWNAAYFYIDAVPFATGSAWGQYTDDDIQNSRANLVHRFDGGDAPTVDWAKGSQWHRHVCYELEAFSLERCRRIQRALDSAMLKGAARASTLAALA